ncbi:MAG: hypothetical protein UGF89_03585 [Acutalibacteraceae bacterium]|nr:hypothetical protein [Acutalibacteraceae bacterium]
MKNAIINFLKNGCYQGTKYTAEDFIAKLEFLAFIIKKKDEGAPEGGIWANDNWFWCYANRENRNDLLIEVELIKKFNTKDPSYNILMDKYKHRDCYGIMFPVTRSTIENVEAESLNKALGHYVSKGTPPWDRLFSKVEKSFYMRYKLVYCSERNYPLSDVLDWDMCERILSAKLNYREYKVVCDTLYGSPEDLKNVYMSSEYTEAVSGMQRALTRYILDLKKESELRVNDILYCYYAGNVQRSSDLLDELKSYYEHREGASKTEKEEQSKRLDSYTAQIPVDVVSAICSLKAKAVS